jgi:hypothetical protein
MYFLCAIKNKKVASATKKTLTKMNSHICKAILKFWPGDHPCKNPAKCGEFCGVHAPSDPNKVRNLCQGLTKTGKKCTHPVKRGQYCSRHVIPEHPDHDYEELSLYTPDVNWPWMDTILNRVKKCKSGKELDEKISTYKKYNIETYELLVFEIINEEENTKRDNKFTIYLMQSFFVNYYLDYSSEYWQSIITDLSKKTENVVFLKGYRELFRKKFDLEYRQETKKKFISLILVQGVGRDLAKIIVNYL